MQTSLHGSRIRIQGLGRRAYDSRFRVEGFRLCVSVFLVQRLASKGHGLIAGLGLWASCSLERV